MGFGTPLAEQVKAVALGIFHGYPVDAIQSYLTYTAFRRGWVTLTEEEQLQAFGTDIHDLGFIPSPAMMHLSKADLCFTINMHRYATWPINCAPAKLPSDTVRENRLQKCLSDKAFQLRVEKALEQLKLYTCPKSIHIPNREY